MTLVWMVRVGMRVGKSTRSSWPRHRRCVVVVCSAPMSVLRLHDGPSLLKVDDVQFVLLGTLLLPHGTLLSLGLGVLRQVLQITLLVTRGALDFRLPELLLRELLNCGTLAMAVTCVGLFFLE